MAEATPGGIPTGLGGEEVEGEAEASVKKDVTKVRLREKFERKEIFGHAEAGKIMVREKKKDRKGASSAQIRKFRGTGFTRSPRTSPKPGYRAGE